MPASPSPANGARGVPYPTPDAESTVDSAPEHDRYRHGFRAASAHVLRACLPVRQRRHPRETSRPGVRTTSHATTHNPHPHPHPHPHPTVRGEP
ncbi:hypothetical protein [Streptomyces hokutonensis]|uniref:hypothetical protein n=1 Tax=Streptomyces hokutonensis TaxID=1306990 RepID=UPI0036A506E9